MKLRSLVVPVLSAASLAVAAYLPDVKDDNDAREVDACAYRSSHLPDNMRHLLGARCEEVLKQAEETEFPPPTPEPLPECKDLIPTDTTGSDCKEEYGTDEGRAIGCQMPLIDCR